MKTGQDVRARRQAGMGWEPGELKVEHKGQNHNLKIKITLDSTLHTHSPSLHRKEWYQMKWMLYKRKEKVQTQKEKCSCRKLDYLEKSQLKGPPQI